MSTQIKGIDVSTYQGKIDWVKVKEDGVQFAFIRCGWCYYDGRISLDERFHENMAGANAAGVDVGVYLYSYANSEAGMVQAARETLALCKPYRVSYPIVLDFEETKDTLYTKRKKAKNAELCRAFLNIIEQAGYYAMLYTYTYFANAYLDMSSLARYDAWIADYRGYIGYKGTYGIWQHSSKGAVQGISGNVDMNWSYNDYAKLIAKLGLNRLEETSEVKPEPEPEPASPAAPQWKVETGPFKDSVKLEKAKNIYLLAGYDAEALETAAGDAMKVQIKNLAEDKAKLAAAGMQALTGWQTNAYKVR